MFPTIFKICILFAFISVALNAGENVQLGWGSTGINSLTYQGRQYLARGEFMVNAADFSDAGGHVIRGNPQCRIVENPAQKTTGLNFDWGSINVHYQNEVDDRLTLRIEILNQSKSALSALSLDALALQLPSPPKEFAAKQPMLATNIGAPTLLPLDCKPGSILVTNDDVSRPLLVGMPWSLNGAAATVFPIRINTGRDPMYPDSLPVIHRSIPPGGKDTYEISLRFSPGAADVASQARDVIAKFAGLNDFTLHWPDRRPIASLILATAATNWKTNPRGWLLDPAINITTPAGVAAFHTRILAWADHSIAILKSLHAQGMITWDIEGEQFPHATTYVGDPTMTQQLAPEVTGVVDEYFKRFRDAGLRVGVTLRPQHLELNGGAARQVEVSDPAAELMRKITFARKRWGATLFYIDSDGDAVNPMSSDVITKVMHSFPDILLIPEHKNVAYYAKSAPYSECRGGHYATPSWVTAIYPKAFSVLNTADSPSQKHYDELLSAVNRGDILMFRGWFDDPNNATVKAIYEHSMLNPSRNRQ